MAENNRVVRTTKADIFLYVKGQRQGVIKGETNDLAHADQIDVLAWNWGVSGPYDQYTGAKTGRRAHQPLQIVKHTDAASTPLYNALSTNELLKEVKLSVRKAGVSATGKPVDTDYLVITLEDAGIVSMESNSGPADAHDLTDKVSFVFKKIEINYRKQGPNGLLQGNWSFADEWTDGK